MSASRIRNFSTILIVAYGLFLSSVSLMAHAAGVRHQLPLDTTPDRYLSNPNFECTTGVYTVTDSTGQPLIIPDQWSWTPISGTPKLITTRFRVTGGCDLTSSKFVDRIEGDDSYMFRSADIESTDKPGKSFDVALAQPMSVTPGLDYSITGFMASFCGGSASPNDCPDGYYISKLVGLDPNGGVDPLTSSVAWVENREPHTSAGYANVSVAARANAPTMTAFIRVHSPFQWHGNHAIIDDFRMVEAPSIAFTDLPNEGSITGTMGIALYSVTGRRVELRWEGSLSDDIQNIEGESYQLLADLQYRSSGESAWQDLITGHVGDGCQVFVAPELNEVIHFRIGALAARPTTGGHRFRSRWSDPIAIQFLPDAGNSAHTASIVSAETITSPINQLFLPVIDQPISLRCE